MALNPDYVPLTPLWEVFTDKDTLTFLADGYVLFFVDTARTVGKPVYQITGSPPNYTYAPYGSLQLDGSWRVNMNLQGAFDQVIYGYPLDDDGNVQLYFAEFYSSDGVLQFTREGFPNFFIPGGSTTNEIEINFIPDGQFRLHEDIPPTLTLELGEVREPVTNIAYGGWTFNRPMASTARDFVTFQRIGSYVTNPAKSPRYLVEVTCEAPNAGDTFKDLRVRFDDVNKFASDTDMYTFAITDKFVSSGSVDVQLVLIKNFGTGGDAESETVLTTFTVTSTFVSHYFSFVFGANTGSIIGPNNDDYVELAIRFPSNQLFDTQFTDALLTPGNIVNPVFKDTPTREFLYESLFDDTDCPAFDGSDIGLPLVLTKTGLRFDDSQVGFIFPSSTPTAPFGFLETDGQGYDTTLHSPDGIPFSRIGNKLKLVVPVGEYAPLEFETNIYGSGYQFFQSSILDSLDAKLSLNASGTAASTTDGANPTGFTFRTNCEGSVSITSSAYLFYNSSLYIIANDIGLCSTAISSTIPGLIEAYEINSTEARSVTAVFFAGITLSAGQYFKFFSPSVSYYVWYTIDGAGADPAPGGTGIQVNLYGAYTAKDVARLTVSAISGKKTTEITTVAAASIPQSSYFNLFSTTDSYYVWYNTGGAGTDPMISGKIGIEVQIESSDTKNLVTQKTVSYISDRFVGTPDCRGIFLKGFDNGSSIDIDSSARYARNSVFYADFIGSVEYSNNISHNHLPLVLSADAGVNPLFGLTNNAVAATEIYKYSDFPVGAVPQNTIPLISYQGSGESRPVNMYVNYVIKY